jgi:hypothetical protein
MIFSLEYVGVSEKNRYPSFSDSSGVAYGDHSRWIIYPSIIVLYLLALFLYLFSCSISISFSRCVYDINSNGLLVVL